MIEKNSLKNIETAVYEHLLLAGVELPQDVLDALDAAASSDGLSPEGAVLLSAIQKNLRLAQEHRLPMCQDTGMVLVFLDIGEEICVPLGDLKRSIEYGIEHAYRDGSFRKSVIAEPVYDRSNTGTNLPAVFSIEIVPGDEITVHLLLKGFGSENCSGLCMINPTAGEPGVIEAVCSIVRSAGGKPCPPIFVGVGIGGTSERAALLSKRALLRDIGSRNADPRYARLEEKLFESIDALSIGPGGFGGAATALGVAVEQEATHIAGMPVAVSINCWADRKAHFRLNSRGELL